MHFKQINCHHPNFHILFMKPESHFDKSVCCVCFQSICMKLELYHMMLVIIVTMGFVGCVVNITYYNNPEKISQEVHTVGLWLHFVSLGLMLLMTSYLGRYLSGTQHNRYDGNFRYNYHNLIAYIMVPVYWFFIMVYLSCIADNYAKGRPIETINGCSEGVIIYFASSIVLWYWVVVFKPIIPNWLYAFNIDAPKHFIPFDEDRDDVWRSHGFFVNFFTKYVFYEQDEDVERYAIWSSVSLLVMFGISVAVMNCSFAIYYNDRTYHDVMIALSTASTFIALFLQGMILLAIYKGRSTLNADYIEERKKFIYNSWLYVIGGWSLASVFVFFIYVPYEGNWDIADGFEETCMMRNIFYMVQGGIFLLAIVIAAIYGSYVCVGCCFCSVADEIYSAQSKVDGFAIVLDGRDVNES